MVRKRGQLVPFTHLECRSKKSKQPEHVQVEEAWSSGLSPTTLTVLTLCQVCMCYLFSPVRLFATTWAVACQAALSMGFPGQEH